AVIVEGYTDVIAMHLAGVKTAVATCGTALGDGHFDLLRRFGDRVVLAFDSDEAGSKAALRGDELESPFRLDLDLRVAAMPDGLDPADLVQQDRTDELVASVRSARPLLERRIEHEVSRHDLSGPEGKARALHAAADQVRRVGDEIARREYIRFVARLIGADLETVTAAVEGGRRRGRPAPSVSQRPLDRMESELLRFLIANPDRMGEVGPDDFADERLAAAFVALSTGGSSERSPNGDDSGSAASGLLRSLSMEDRPASGEEIMGRIKERRLDRLIDALEAELAELEPGSEPHSDSLRRLIALQKEKRSLAES
ncbi:MAG: toprim domain-containing protein, partial [Acidimicrobiia bacterium]